MNKLQDSATLERKYTSDWKIKGEVFNRISYNRTVTLNSLFAEYRSRENG